MKPRDYRLDKAKGLLIFIVVFGHFLEQISGWDMGYSRALLTGIYSFHMPAFVFLAGITAKSTRLIDRLLVFIVLVVTAQPVYYYWISFFGSPPGLELDEPYWITWFLLAMVWWLLLLPLVERFPIPMLIVSLGIGVLGGALPAIDYELSIGRTMTFFPFFVIGKLYGKPLLNWASKLHVAKKLALSVAALLPIGIFFVQGIDHRWFYGARGFEYLEHAIPYGVGMRVLISSSAMLTTMVLLAWSQRLPKWIVPAGQHSLAIFLIHGLIIRAIDVPLNTVLEKTSGTQAIGLCLGLAVIVTGLLSWSKIDQAIRWYSSGVSGLITKVFSLTWPIRTRGKH